MTPGSGTELVPRIPDQKPPGPSRLPWLLAILVALALLGGIIYFWGGYDQPQPTVPQKETPQAAQPAEPGKAPGEPAVPPPPAPSQHGDVIRLQGGGESAQAGPVAEQAGEQEERKKPFGLSKSVDAVVRSDESIKLGDRQVSVKELERQLVVEHRGEILDKPLPGKEKISAWGVYVVRPGDNLWDIHYRLLREYLAGRGIDLPLNADEPVEGVSSGVGKVLKFAENMVGVYNLKTEHMDTNINLLEAGEKVVVFNLSEIFAQLKEISPADLAGISYDGRVLLFPKESSPSRSPQDSPAPEQRP